MSNISFKQVSFRNFLSFGNVMTTLDLTAPGTTLLVGENLDDGGSSGAGKTTGLCAISYCLFDKIPSGVTKDRLINQTNAAKNTQMEVIVEFDRGDDAYKVHRWRGSTTGVKLYHNDKDITPASVNRGEDSFNSVIENILGFSYTMFSKIILFNGSSKPFLSLSASEQRELIEELLRITLLSRKAAALKENVRETEKGIDMQLLLVKQQEVQNATHQRHLAEGQQRIQRWNAQRSADMSALNDELSALLSFDFDTEELGQSALSELDQQMASLVNDTSRVSGQINLTNRESSPHAVKLSGLQHREKQVSEKLTRAKSELKHLRDAECPYCKQAFTSPAKITELSASVDALTQELNELASELVATKALDDEFKLEINQRINELKAEQVKLQASQLELSSVRSELATTLKYKSMTDLIKARASIEALQQKMIAFSSEVNPHLEAVAQLEKEGEVKIDYSFADELKKLLEHQKLLLKLLTDKSSFIRKNIISKTIPFLNGRIGYYTDALNLPHVVEFQPDMTCKITQLGRELDHGNLSNGEQKRLNLALCLAFRDVMTYLHAKVNVLFADEIDGGSLDATCVDALVKLLKRKAWDDELSIFIISHRPEFDDRCDRNVIIRKERGFSTMITQPT